MSLVPELVQSTHTDTERHKGRAKPAAPVDNTYRGLIVWFFTERFQLWQPLCSSDVLLTLIVSFKPLRFSKRSAGSDRKERAMLAKTGGRASQT